jgi:hypothetical protein
VYVSVGNSKGDEIIKLLSMKAMMHWQHQNQQKTMNHLMKKFS